MKVVRNLVRGCGGRRLGVRGGVAGFERFGREATNCTATTPHAVIATCEGSATLLACRGSVSPPGTPTRKENHVMTSILSKVVSILLALAIPVVAAAGEPPSSPAHPDFSGKWTLDLGRSRIDARFFGDLTRGVLRIEHREPSFSFRRLFTQGGESSTVAFTLTTDGKEVEGREDGMPTRQSLTWGGDTLVFLTVYRSPRGEARNTVKYSLDSGGGTLRAEESFRGPRLSYDNLWVFSKAD
jgi:hypothetical protein